jgi:hypothetical protein
MAKFIGYRIVSFNTQTSKSHTLQNNRPVDLSIGHKEAPQGGLFLGTSLDFLDYYRESTDYEDLVLSFEYDEKHIISGTTSEGSEVLVKVATLIDVKFDKQEKQEQLAHVLEPLIRNKKPSKHDPTLSF